MRWLVIVSLLLTGCASTLTIEYDEQDRVSKIIGKGTQTSIIKHGEYEVSMDTKQPSPFKDIINLNGSKIQ